MKCPWFLCCKRIVSFSVTVSSLINLFLEDDDHRQSASVTEAEFSTTPSVENASSSLPSLRSYTLSSGEVSARTNRSRWVYPSLQSNQSSITTQRPQSYAGNSANSFQDASYLR